MTSLATTTSLSLTREDAERQSSIVEAGWRTLYRLGALAAFAVLALVPIQMVVYVLWPPPTTVFAWFDLFRSSSLVGLLDMDLLLIVDFGLLAVFFLALYAALRRGAPSLSALFLMLELVAAATYFASATAFEMLAASDLFAAAANEAGRTVALAVGQTLLLTWQGTTFGISYVLAGLAMTIASLVMLRLGPFGKVTAWVGIFGGLMSIVPSNAGTIGLVLSLASLVPVWAWLILAGRTLLRLSAEQDM